MSKIILILGASYVGLTATHSLLKYALKGLDEYRIVLVSPTTHHYWNMASVRAIIPGQFSDDKLFASIPDGIAKYGTAIEFILGTAVKLDTTSRSVTISTAAGARPQSYDILIIATGQTTQNDDTMPWTSAIEGYEATRDRLHKLQERVKSAKTVVLGGGGPTGVETAGELGFEYGNSKEVTLFTSGTTLLTGLPASVATAAEKELQKLRVKIVYSTKITAASLTSTGQTELLLSNGATKIVDVYLPTTGTSPNTSFVPGSLLDSTGRLQVDEFLRVKNAQDVWAAGDVIALEGSQFVYAEKQAIHPAKNIDLVIHGKEPVPYKLGPRMMGLTIGRSRGTGHLGNFKLPSLAVWLTKGRTIGTQLLLPLVSGSKF